MCPLGIFYCVLHSECVLRKRFYCIQVYWESYTDIQTVTQEGLSVRLRERDLMELSFPAFLE